jgi:hypothetical protein
VGTDHRTDHENRHGTCGRNRLLVRVIQSDPASGLSEILVGGIIKPLWTYSRFLTARPIHDIYGISKHLTVAVAIWRRECELSLDPLIRTIHPAL